MTVQTTAIATTRASKAPCRLHSPNGVVAVVVLVVAVAAAAH